MKPTNKQLFIASIIKECSDDWMTTNDINSPSHFTLIDETVESNREKYGLENEDITGLDLMLSNLLHIIRNHV